MAGILRASSAASAPTDGQVQAFSEVERVVEASLAPLDRLILDLQQNHKQRLTEQDALITALKEQVSERDAEIKALKEQASERDAEIKGLKWQLSERDAENRGYRLVSRKLQRLL